MNLRISSIKIIFSPAQEIGCRRVQASTHRSHVVVSGIEASTIWLAVFKSVSVVLIADGQIEVVVAAFGFVTSDVRKGVVQIIRLRTNIQVSIV